MAGMNHTSQAKRPLCSLPWFQIDIRYTGQVQPCCMMGTIGTIHAEELMQIWNGERYRQLRHRLASHDLQYTPCESCTHRLQGNWQEFPVYALKDDAARKANFDVALEHYNNGDLLLTSRPVSYRMDVTNECNLSCVMCDQNHDPKSNRERFPRVFIDRFFENGYFAAAGEIVLVGGEPLFVDESLEILKRAASVGPGECQLNLQTNGLLMGKNWEEIKAFKNAYFAISIDGCTPDTYEKIRRGGRWSNLCSMLDRIKAVVESETWRNWKTYHAHVVMRSNILELPVMLNFAHAYGAEAGFSPMYDTDNRQENIFLLNWLLEDIPIWQQVLDQSIKMTDQLGFCALTRESLVLVAKLLLAEPWITRKRESQIRQHEGVEGLRHIFRQKVAQVIPVEYSPAADLITFVPMSGLVPEDQGQVSRFQGETGMDTVADGTEVPRYQRQEGHPLAGYAGQLIYAISTAENRVYYRDQSIDSLLYLVDIVKAVRPTRIVELGTLSGLSLRTWRAAVPDVPVTAIDLSFQSLMRSREIMPLDLSTVTLLEQDILTVDFGSLWRPDERVLLYIDAHDLPGVPIMQYLLDTAIPCLPAGSLVMVDDVWYSPEQLDQGAAEQFFQEVVINQIDPLQCFDGYYASYWEGGAFFGFMEVVPLLEWVNNSRLKLVFSLGIKSVAFTWSGK
jgi:predicted O-methyltransferase YrrM